MELIVIIWVILAFVINVIKKKNAEERKQSGGYRAGVSREMQDRVSSWSKKTQNNMGGRASQSRNARPVSSGRNQESWRNTAEVTRSDISFRGLREGEDELAYLIRKNTAYEKHLEARLVSRES